MLTLISPAKKLNFDRAAMVADITMPQLAQDMRAILSVAKKQSASDLKRLMHLSDKLAELNADRFRAFEAEGLGAVSGAAGLAFDGDVYWGLEAKTMAPDTLSYAQGHLRILSGLYGLLRPLDAIQPYRLEMGTRLANSRGASLYDFWGSRIAELLDQELCNRGVKVIVNLASDEYFRAVDQTALKARVITASFINIKDGEPKKPMYHVKFARGLMARWIMENRIEDIEALKQFDSEGYRYDATNSNTGELVFSREQPPVKA